MPRTPIPDAPDPEFPPDLPPDVPPDLPEPPIEEPEPDVGPDEAPPITPVPGAIMQSTSLHAIRVMMCN
ncbi:hypothetical protein [Ensifer adhaerens]|uniref:hypothetical protein n=1 Tax=Ensifer adhaerens TaxID=106592 RepID=UPI0009900EFC|nr:hypothetical protein [Ensifer adhaerens]